MVQNDRPKRDAGGYSNAGEADAAKGRDSRPATPASSAAGSVPVAPTLSLPKGGGAIRGIDEKFSTNLVTGTASFSVPIATSHGRGGFSLELGLSYDSGAGNGPFGLGWHASAPAIVRKTDKGLPQYIDAEESDVFVLSGAEDLEPVRVPDVPSRDGYRIQRYRPRVEGLFARIERWTSEATGDAHFRVITRDNVTNIYGRSATARIADPAAPSRVFSWLLEETRDDRGNVVRYTYKAEDGAGVDPAKLSEVRRFERAPGGGLRFVTTAQRYLKRIQYGNRVPIGANEPAPVDPSAWHFEVVFDYGEHDQTTPTPDDGARPWTLRSDPFSSARAGFEVRTYRLCRRVLMFHRFAELGEAPCLVRSTDFTYDESPALTYLTQVEQAGYTRRPGSASYARAALPPLALDYARLTELDDTVQTLDQASFEGIPEGVGGATQWVDLDGEGIPGVLRAGERGWYYKANLGEGRLAPPAVLRSLPIPAELSGGFQQLVDLEGDGRLELVCYSQPLAGYFTRTTDGAWEPFRSLRSVPNIDWNDANLRTIDLDGDGHPDVLITEHDALVWYRSLAEEGFEPARRLGRTLDEEKGPAVVFADGTESIYLADMSGDGLVDIVRVRSGEVCYWPNLGHGRFGAKVTMDRSPRFDRAERFDPKRVRFADVDGSGPADILYLGRDGVAIYFNQSGNGFSEGQVIRSLPLVDTLAGTTVVDLRGRGTQCLVWSSPAPERANRPLAFIDLMGGVKPHLLVSIKNNLGAETRISYASSTKFYLQDKAAGTPWITRLPFPVQVIARIEHYDHVARSKLVTQFAYHHGYFDGYEREFRGFACVDQWDAESFSGGSELDLPPVRTVTWFHNGAWLDRERLERELARGYYAQDPRAPLLPDTLLPANLSVREEREAARALRGQILRQEIYAEDGTPESAHPYTVSEKNHEVRLLQKAEGDGHAVFCVHPRNTITLHYERNPNDPRMQHELVLDVDDFGNIIRSATIAYPRRSPVEPEQARLWATLTEHAFANRPDEPDWYRIGVPIETVTNELTGLAAPAQGVLSVEDVAATAALATEIPYEVEPNTTGAASQRRVIERERHLYYRDDLSGPLPVGQIESRALAHEAYRQVLTPGLVAQVYGARVDDMILEAEGHYVRDDAGWWAPSGHAVFDPARFYLPVESVDPFGQRHVVRYDAYALLVLDVEDPLHNRVTSGARDVAGNITQNGNDYRMLAPALLTDPNRNRTAVAFDALGMVVATAVMGKEGDGEGDTLADPTTRLEYDLHRWKRTNGAKPALVHTLIREQHGPANPRWQETYGYFDGVGREAMKKIQAEPGPVPVLDAEGHLVRNADGTPRTRQELNRWIGTGRTVLDNKGNPVKKYEPFFSGTSDYEDESELVEWGVTPILRYDPPGRLIRTDKPDGTHTLVVFDAWKQETWDENDTVAGTPWLAKKQAGTAAERRCAALALAHAGTPAVAHLDSLGRVFLTVANNGPAGLQPTRLELDIEGNQRSVIDARGNMILRQVFDMVAHPIRVVRADAGPRDAAGQRRAVPVATDPDGACTLLDVAEVPIRMWNERGFAIRHRCDALRRPTHLYVRQGAGPEALVERTVYGETHAQAEARNLRTRIYQSYDGAGALTNVRFDLEGNLLETTRHLAKEFRSSPDWLVLGELTSAAAIESAANPFIEAETFTVTAAYDALDRVTSRTTPDGSETRPSYNEASLLEKIEVRIRGAAAWTTFVADIDYNARGQRERIEHGNGTITDSTYDEQTFRLVRLRTLRTADNTTLQDLCYENDPAGNIVAVADAVSFGNPTVSADGLYEYDALYQLVKTEGREHPGQQPADQDAALLGLPSAAQPNDWQALRRYREIYSYDAVGNIERLQHEALGPGPAGWTRRYAYAPDSNRLLRTSAPGDAPAELSAAYEYDDAGSMTRMPHLPAMAWDHADRLQAVNKQVQNGSGPANEVHFTYDSSGQRVRKVYEHGGLIEERIYFNGYEVYRKRSAGATQPDLERATLHVMDDRRRVALVETKTIDTSVPGAAATTRQRFQIGNHLGSSSMEVTDAGAVIDYEEYYPFGASSFRATDSATEVSVKRYRYTGKERDEETGLYYHGARYYAEWLERWTSSDPKGLLDGPNLYTYVHNCPLGFIDPDGYKASPIEQAATATPIVVQAARSTPWQVGAARTALGAMATDGITPDPSDVAWPKWAAYAVVATIAVTVLYLSSESNSTTEKSSSESPKTQNKPSSSAKQAPGPKSNPKPKPVVSVPPSSGDRNKKENLGRIYVTYFKVNAKTNQIYSGRTSMIVDLNRELYPQAVGAVATRDLNHHVDENREPKDRDFGIAFIDKYDVGKAINYTDRYKDNAYLSIRGREQQVIDFHGRARSDTGKPYKTENAVRGVGKDNMWGRRFHDAASAKWKELHPYTGN